MSRPTYMTINLRALKYNLARVRELAPHSQVMAMVKANGYGHGLSAVGLALSDADALGVASLEEGMILRAAGILEQPIVLMEGLFHQNELLDAIHHNFTLVVHHLEHVKMLETAKVKKPFTVWLKINTGMHRLGVDPSEFTSIYQRLLATNAVQKPIRLMTHFAEADDKESDATPKQIEVFNRILNELKGPRSLANSAGILAWPNAHGDWVRPGLILYGASPFANLTGQDHNLQPVMTLWSRLIAITHVKRGGKVGYGGTWTAPEDMNVGVVGVGYGDGYPQSAKSGTPILVNGVLCELVGRVSMDMLTVDLRNNPQAQISDRVILWGEGLPVERIARYCQTSAYEVLTRMTPRPKIQIAHHSK